MRSISTRTFSCFVESASPRPYLATEHGENPVSRTTTGYYRRATMATISLPPVISAVGIALLQRDEA